MPEHTTSESFSADPLINNDDPSLEDASLGSDYSDESWLNDPGQSSEDFGQTTQAIFDILDQYEGPVRQRQDELEYERAWTLDALYEMLITTTTQLGTHIRDTTERGKHLVTLQALHRMIVAREGTEGMEGTAE